MKKILLNLSFVAFAFGLSSTAAFADTVTVQKGDSIWSIAKKYNVSFAEMLRLNKSLKNPHLIYPNQKLVLPSGSTGTGTTANSQSDNIKSGNSQSNEAGTSTQAQAVLELVNAERSKQGLPSLKLANSLTSIATTKAKDMAVNNYFNHTSPTYGTPFQMLQQFGIHYMSAGENIAAGQRTAQEVMNSWMNSSGHRANILNANFDTIGIGYYKGGSYGVYWTQLFIGN